MLKNFKQYCNVYNICEDENILEQYKNIANIVIEQKNKNIISYHRHGYLFYYFDKLVKSEISLEEFFMLGDITGSYNILEYQNKNSPNIKSMEILYQRLQEQDEKLEDSLIIIDSWAYNWFVFNYQGEEYVVKKLAEKQNSQVVFL